MTPKFHALEPWELMNTAKKLIGLTGLELIFKIGHGQIYKFCRNPRYSSDSAHTPLERVRMLVADVADQGEDGTELARAMVDFMAEPLGMHLTHNAAATPDKPTLAEECLDDLPVLAALHTAIRAGHDPREVEALLEEAKEELAQSVAKYKEGLEA